METLVNLLTSPPILALPDWKKSFQLHTNATETGAGAVLTQIQEIVEKTLVCASYRWSKTDEKKPPTNRKCLAVLWAIDKFASYLQAKSLTLRHADLAIQKSGSLRGVSPIGTSAYAVRHGAPVATGNETPT